MTKIYNANSNKKKRRALRKSMPTPEVYLWQKLRNKQLGVKFRRQHGISPYITDFYSAEIKLAIEVDDDSHFNKQAEQYDLVRTHYFKALSM